MSPRARAGFAPSLLLWLVSGCAVLAANSVSLIDDLNNEVDSRLARANPVNTNLFSSINDDSDRYVRNPSVWTGNIDLTGIAVHSFRHHEATQAGTLITPADIILVHHYQLALGDRCAFVDNQNVTYYARVIAIANVVGDLTVEHIGWLRKVPTTLKVMPILAPDYRLYAPDHNLSPFPVICTNQFRQVIVQEAAASLGVGLHRLPFDGGLFFHVPARASNRVPFTRPIIRGDSGQPVMAVIHGEAVLITCNTTANWGLSYPDHFEAINQALAAMGSRHRATAVDLSSFPAY
jgi:hypothetical protein